MSGCDAGLCTSSGAIKQGFSVGKSLKQTRTIDELKIAQVPVMFCGDFYTNFYNS
jgi:hypothetical protein